MICRRCGVNNRAQNIFSFIIVLTGVLLFISGLCIMVIGMVRQ